MILEVEKFIEDTEKYRSEAFKYKEPDMISWHFVKRSLKMIIEKTKRRQNERTTRDSE